MFFFVPNPTRAKHAWSSSTCLLYDYNYCLIFSRFDMLKGPVVFVKKFTQKGSNLVRRHILLMDMISSSNVLLFIQCLLLMRIQQHLHSAHSSNMLSELRILEKKSTLITIRDDYKEIVSANQPLGDYSNRLGRTNYKFIF